MCPSTPVSPNPNRLVRFSHGTLGALDADPRSKDSRFRSALWTELLSYDQPVTLKELREAVGAADAQCFGQCTC